MEVRFTVSEVQHLCCLKIVIDIEFVHISMKEDSFLYIIGERAKRVRHY